MPAFGALIAKYTFGGIDFAFYSQLIVLIKKTRIQIPSLNAGHSSHLYHRFRISQPQIIVIIWRRDLEKMSNL